MRESFVFYRSFREAIKDIPVEEQLKAYNTILDYAFDGKEPTETGISSAVFKLVKPQIDANNKRYENGKKGGRPKTKTKPNNNQNITELIPNVNVNVNDNVNVNKKISRFAPPSLEEVRAYCLERNNSVDPEAFIDFYSSKGWKVGNQSMKDWKAAVRTWEKREKDKPKDKIHFENERNYDIVSIEKKLLAKNGLYG